MSALFDRLRALRPGASVPQILFYEFCRRVCALVLILFFRYKPYRRERVPATGPLIIAANHQSYLDPPMVGCLLSQRGLTYVARAGLFKFKPFGWLIGAVGSVPLKEDEGDAGAIREFIRQLGMGRAVLIFPEGSRTRTGAMGPFKRGVALLVKKAKCPVQPVAVEGVFDAWPRGGLPRPFVSRVAVMYGQPIAYDELMKDGADAALERLRREIDAMRLELRAKLREASHGTYPRPGPGDAPATANDEAQPG